MSETPAPDVAPDDFVAQLELASRLLAGTSGSAVDLPVAACPGWGIGRLVGHVGRIHRWATALLQFDPPQFVPASEVESPPRDDTVWAWFEAGVPELVDELRRGDLASPVQTWAGEQPRAWWLRRATHETRMHAWDAQLASGATPEPVDAALAVDGIDELFGVFYPTWFVPESFGGAGESVHLHCTDVEGEWLVRYDPDAVVVTREHAKGTVAVRGTANDLLLFLWGRSDGSSCEVFGDRAFLDRALAASSF